MCTKNQITTCILSIGLLFGCGADTDNDTLSDLGTAGSDAHQTSSDATVDQEPQDGAMEPNPIAAIASGQSSLIVHETPKELRLLHNGITRLRLPLDGFQVGSVPEIDPAVNYNPFYIWSNLPSSRRR